MYGDVICTECEIMNPEITRYMGHVFCKECGAEDSIQDMEDWLEEGEEQNNENIRRKRNPLDNNKGNVEVKK